MRERADGIDLQIALALMVAGAIEVLLGPADGRVLRLLAVPLTTLPLAWRRTRPLVPLVAVAAVLPVEAAVASYFEAELALSLVVIVLAVYSAGRHVAGGRRLAAAIAATAGLAATRIGFDPTVAAADDAILTFVGVTVPFLAGRWIHGQARLERQLERDAAERERARARDARQAAEEERMRIATDLQSAVAGRLAEILRATPGLRAQLAAGEHGSAREQLGAVAAAAREALADTRRVLGVLRHAGDAAPLAPPPAASDVAAPASADPGHAATAVEAPPAAALRPPAASRTAAAPDTAGAPDTAAAPDAAIAPRTAAASRPAAAPHTHAASAVRARIAAADAAWLDGALVGALALAGAIELAARETGTDRLLGVATALLVALPLLWRRRAPAAAALGVMAAVALQSALLRPTYFAGADGAALICGAYALGAYAERRRAVVGIAALALAEGLHAVAFHPEGVAIAVFAAAAVPWAVGRIARNQRRLVAATRAHAEAVERRRERDAVAAVTAERMRVARELHDAVAHNISVIAIQAAAADGVVERDPARAAECAALIETVAREAVGELSRLAELPSDAPQPTLARVESLAERARAAGLPVELRVEGRPGRLPAGLDLAGFRIVQEALANASKHAGRARAWVVVRYEHGAVELEIGDDGRGPNGTTSSGTGHGLVGMRERAALYGGTVEAGRRPGGGFAVRARLPIGGA